MVKWIKKVGLFIAEKWLDIIISGSSTGATWKAFKTYLPDMNGAYIWLICWAVGLFTIILLPIRHKFKNNKIKKGVKIIYKLTKLDIVFRIQNSYSGDYKDTLVVNVENKANIKYQLGQVFRPLDKQEKKVIAVIFLEFEIPLETISINGYQLDTIERNKGSIQILYVKYCNFENKNFVTACCIALHGIEETKNSSFRIQFLPSQ